DRLPHRVIELVRVLGERDGWGVRRGDAANDGCHDAGPFLSSHAQRQHGCSFACMMARARALRQVNFRIYGAFVYANEGGRNSRLPFRPPGSVGWGLSPQSQLRCLETAAVILNIEIWSPPITAPSLASGLIMRLS